VRPCSLRTEKVASTGVGIGGIDTILTRAPIGSNIRWNIRAGFRAPDLCSLSGSFVPFAKTKAERLTNGDPRQSLEERYKDHAGFVKAIEKATKDLVKERFLLEETPGDTSRRRKSATYSDKRWPTKRAQEQLETEAASAAKPRSPSEPQPLTVTFSRRPSWLQNTWRCRSTATGSRAKSLCLNK